MRHKILRGSGRFSHTVYLEDDAEIEVDVEYQGYSDPGVLSGPVELSYAPEGEMEILSVSHDGVAYPVSDEEMERIEEAAWEWLEESSQRGREE